MLDALRLRYSDIDLIILVFASLHYILSLIQFRFDKAKVDLIFFLHMGL